MPQSGKRLASSLRASKFEDDTEFASRHKNRRDAFSDASVETTKQIPTQKKSARNRFSVFLVFFRSELVSNRTESEQRNRKKTFPDDLPSACFGAWQAGGETSPGSGLNV